ncbi:conjugative transposon protein TraN [Niabella sp. CC-SYL272]|uniref:conjugative transposon protein TraN n=1 Tax=Niabella agricola TaxID=2891571 RepID=UPI001F1FD742|nr:conjugative transposon protein TraN [Niabella agricola]MCF3109597.1 conjugative transposon protein TraN [Niabella agricola]
MQAILKSFFFVFLLAAGVSSLAQTAPFYQQAMQEPYHLYVNDLKTTVLIFPAAIAANGVDRGTGDILAKTITGVDNILKVKGATASFPQTNLTVVTTDGRVYAFNVDYSATPDEKPIDLGKQRAEEAAQALFKSRKLNDEQVGALAKVVASTQPFLKTPKEKSFKMRARLEGIYTAEDVVFYRVALENYSPIDYDLDFARFYVRDKKRLKRTAEQEQELTPLLIHKELGNTTVAHSKQVLVFAFSKFTVANKKNFIIQLFEQSGDRHLQLNINGYDIVKARPLKQ